MCVSLKKVLLRPHGGVEVGLVDPGRKRIGGMEGGAKRREQGEGGKGDGWGQGGGGGVLHKVSEYADEPGRLEAIAKDAKPPGREGVWPGCCRDYAEGRVLFQCGEPLPDQGVE